MWLKKKLSKRKKKNQTMSTFFFYQFLFLLVCNITDKKQQQPNDSQNCVSTLPRGCIYNFPYFLSNYIEIENS